MAVTGHPITVQVAGRVLESGGNAIDAGVAAALATNVVQVDMCNLGGIAPILIRPAGTQEVVSVAGIGRWSSTATADAYVDAMGRRCRPGVQRASCREPWRAGCRRLRPLAHGRSPTWRPLRSS